MVLFTFFSNWVRLVIWACSLETADSCFLVTSYQSIKLLSFFSKFKMYSIFKSEHNTFKLRAVCTIVGGDGTINLWSIEMEFKKKCYLF